MSAERWWICTDQLAQGGRAILGPFESRELALDVRYYVEMVKNVTYWVEREES